MPDMNSRFFKYVLKTVNVDYHVELKANERIFELHGKVLNKLITSEREAGENEHLWH